MTSTNDDGKKHWLRLRANGNTISGSNEKGNIRLSQALTTDNYWNISEFYRHNNRLCLLDLQDGILRYSTIVRMSDDMLALKGRMLRCVHLKLVPEKKQIWLTPSGIIIKREEIEEGNHKVIYLLKRWK